MRAKRPSQHKNLDALYPPIFTVYLLDEVINQMCAVTQPSKFLQDRVKHTGVLLGLIGV